MRRCLPLAAVSLILLAAAAAIPKTYNTPTIDGHVTTDPGDWEADEWAVDDPDYDCRYVPNDADMDDLYVTWDADSLYVGVKTARAPGGYGNGYLVFIDTDAQSGITGATDFTASTYYPRHITFSTMGVDAIIAGWNLPVTFEVKHIADVQNPTDVEGVRTVGQNTIDVRHYEAAISWDGLFGLGPGTVPLGTTLRFVAAIVGGDNSGAYDAMPTTSTGAESNPGLPWDTYTDLDNYYEATIDANQDGVPDTGYPPGGSISGTVVLDEPGDTETVVTVTAYLGGEAIKSADTPPGGGEYTIPLLPDGEYTVEAVGFGYLPESQDVVLEDEAQVTGVDFTLTRVDGAIEGEVALSGGPAVDVTVTAYDTTTGEVGGDGPQVVAGGAGSFRINIVLDGTYRVDATADVGLLTLPAVVATKYSFTDSAGSTVFGVGTTVSIPDSGIYYYAEAWVEPRDDDDRVARWDVGAQDSVLLSATKLDPSYPPSGQVFFAGPDSTLLPGSVIPGSLFVDGRAPFLVAGDAVEVLRVRASNGVIEGAFEAGIAPAAPTRLELTADMFTIPVGGDSVVQVIGQLRDAAGNPARFVGIPLTMSATGAGGEFSVRTILTDSNGSFEVTFWGTVSGVAQVTAIIDPGSEYAAIAVNTLEITLEPGEASLVEVSVSPVAFRAEEAGVVTAEIVDEWGNAVPLEGVPISLSATPSDLIAVLETPIETDSLGVAVGEIAAGPDYGLVELSASAAGLPVATVFLPIDPKIVTVDEAAPESDTEHNSDPGVDLTIVRAEVDSADLLVTLDFQSNWDGVHLALILETAADAGGGTTDPFGFPISYDHDLLPDYCFTYKYAAADYADLRKYEGGQWKHRNFDTNEWVVGYQEGVNAVEQGLVWKTQEQVTFTVPLDIVQAAPGDSVRMQVYVMQETEGQKRTALDSAPHDATHDMTPEVGEWWETATDPVTLSNWATFLAGGGGAPPLLSDGLAHPAIAAPDTMVTYTVLVEDGGGGVGDVFVDLSRIGDSRYTRMKDDGVGPDEFAGDGIYTAARVVGGGAAGGDYELWVSARDSSNVSESGLAIELTIENPAVAIRSIIDPTGDDHGPNQTDTQENPVEGLYYHYPTDVVFHPGAFDMTRVDVLSDGDRIVFRVFVDSLRYHGEPDAADWGAPEPSDQTCTDPDRTDLNLQKIDIYIDASEAEGATSGFPNRFVDVATVDAWEYGVAVEGWGKWFVVSNGQNSTAGWTLYKNDSDISLCNSHVENSIDISVRRELLGIAADADTADVARAVNSWDVIVTMSSHDGDSNDQNLGAIRWVNQETGQWQFGGGADGIDGRDKDSNIIDVAASPGEGHQEGRSQEEMLDYETDAAKARFAANLTACVLEASYSVDNSPPVVSDFEDPSITDGIPDLQHVPWTGLENAPLVLWTTITDLNEVRSATLKWHPVGDTTALSTVSMVNLYGDFWAADIPKQEIEASTNIIDIPGTGTARDIVVRVRAEDSSPSHNVIETAPEEIAVIEPWATSQTMANADTLLPASDDVFLVFQDGTILVLEAGYPSTPGRMDVVLEPIHEHAVDLSNIRGDMSFVGVARDIRLDDGEGGSVSLADPEDHPTGLVLHYPEYDVGSLRETGFGLFLWNDATERWILKGGNASPSGNTVAFIGIEELGLFGIFYSEALDGGGSSGLAAVTAEPNPFSPNGDGYYDETTISFSLGRPADFVNIDFYDLEGRLARRLVFQEPTEYTGSTPVSVTWNGTDDNGNVVPYGIYVMRVEARFKTEPTFERVNCAVVVLK